MYILIIIIQKLYTIRYDVLKAFDMHHLHWPLNPDLEVNLKSPTDLPNKLKRTNSADFPGFKDTVTSSVFL